MEDIVIQQSSDRFARAESKESLAAQAALTLPAYLSEHILGNSLVRNGLTVIGASALLALSAQVAVPVPFSPVPMTLQPLAVLLIAGALGGARAAAAVMLYLLEGMAGLPVFAQGKNAAMAFGGPTAGYLLAFPLSAGLVGWLSEKGWTRTIAQTVVAMSLGIAVIHLGGWAWLTIAFARSARAAFFGGVVPFLAGDAVKIAIAALLLPMAQKWLSGPRG